MALQTGMSFSKIIILAGAGYGTLLFSGGKLSDVIGELQSLVKGLEKSGEHPDGDSDYSDALVQQIKRLATEIRAVGQQRQVNIINGGSGQMGNLSNLIVPTAAAGALGYGYMWWKGLKLSDLMYVTKKGMANAVSNLTKHLEQVSQTLAAAKAHLTQRIQLLDDKMDSQKEISKAIQNDVHAAAENLSQIGTELWQLQRLVSGLDGKIGTLEEKQDLANRGVLYLCNFVGGKNMELPKHLEDELRISGSTRPKLMGLKDFDNLFATNGEPTATTDIILQDGTNKLVDSPCTPQINQPRTLRRYTSAMC